jgi:hypothetical protein
MTTFHDNTVGGLLTLPPSLDAQIPVIFPRINPGVAEDVTCVIPMGVQPKANQRSKDLHAPPAAANDNKQ